MGRVWMKDTGGEGGRWEGNWNKGAGHLGCVRGFSGVSEVASVAAHFGQGDLAGRITQRGGRGLSCCLRTASWRSRPGHGRPGHGGLLNSGSWSGWNYGRSRSCCRCGADPDNPEIYVCYPGTPSQNTQRDEEKLINSMQLLHIVYLYK